MIFNFSVYCPGVRFCKGSSFSTVTCEAEAPGAVYGRSLTDLESGIFADARSLRDAKRVLRAAIDACLDGRSLKSREVMLALLRHGPDRRPARPGEPVPQREES